MDFQTDRSCPRLRLGNAILEGEEGSGPALPGAASPPPTPGSCVAAQGMLGKARLDKELPKLG